MGDDVSSLVRQARDNPRGAAMLCDVLRAQGREAEALAVGLAAMESAPSDMLVAQLVRGSLSRGVPKWHGPMLDDAARNRCYARAIEQAVRPGMTVLEIGAGAGLLSLMAARAGASVVTCESNPIVATAAVEVIARNGYADRVRVIPKHSGDLQVGVDLPERADLLISEIFDDMLFGEGVAQACAHAREALLKPDAPVLPPRAEVRCALVAMDLPPASRLPARVEGFDVSAFGALEPPPQQWQRVGRNAERRSAPESALRMEFGAADPGRSVDRVTLRSDGGNVAGVAQWLRIDFGGGVVLENDPFGGEPSHWRSPVFPFPAPLDTAPGDLFALTLRRAGGQLVIAAEPDGRVA